MQSDFELTGIGSITGNIGVIKRQVMHVKSAIIRPASCESSSYMNARHLAVQGGEREISSTLSIPD